MKSKKWLTWEKSIFLTNGKGCRWKIRNEFALWKWATDRVGVGKRIVQRCQIVFLFNNTVTLSAYPTRSIERKDLLGPWYIICKIYSGWLFSCLPFLYIQLMKRQLMIEFCYSTKYQSWGIMKFRFVSLI